MTNKIKLFNYLYKYGTNKYYISYYFPFVFFEVNREGKAFSILNQKPFRINHDK